MDEPAELEGIANRADFDLTQHTKFSGQRLAYFDPQTNVIDVHISRLRSKIDKGFAHPLLQTVRGAGYVLRESK